MAKQTNDMKLKQFRKELTTKILYQMKNNPGQWTKSWVGENIPTNAITGKKYQGVNIMALWFSAGQYQFPTNEWATFKQWQSIGARVKPRKEVGPGTRIVKLGK